MSCLRAFRASCEHAWLQECTNCVLPTLPFTFYNITFEFMAADTANFSHGPGEHDCDKASQRLDEIEFDGVYSCVCAPDGTTEGPNCRPLVSEAAPLKHNGSESLVAYAVMATIAVLVVCVVAVHRCVLPLRKTRSRLVFFQIAFHFFLTSAHTCARARTCVQT